MKLPKVIIIMGETHYIVWKKNLKGCNYGSVIWNKKKKRWEIQISRADVVTKQEIRNVIIHECLETIFERKALRYENPHDDNSRTYLFNCRHKDFGDITQELAACLKQCGF